MAGGTNTLARRRRNGRLPLDPSSIPHSRITGRSWRANGGRGCTGHEYVAARLAINGTGGRQRSHQNHHVAGRGDENNRDVSIPRLADDTPCGMTFDRGSGDRGSSALNSTENRAGDGPIVLAMTPREHRPRPAHTPAIFAMGVFEREPGLEPTARAGERVKALLPYFAGPTWFPLESMSQSARSAAKSSPGPGQFPARLLRARPGRAQPAPAARTATRGIC